MRFLITSRKTLIPNKVDSQVLGEGSDLDISFYVHYSTHCVSKNRIESEVRKTKVQIRLGDRLKTRVYLQELKFKVRMEAVVNGMEA